MLGGLARRAALAEKTKSEGKPLLVVDSGDLFFAAANPDPERAVAKARLIGRAYRHMGVAAVNVGDLDLLQGIDFLREEGNQGLPLISANLLEASSKAPLFSPYVIREFSGIRIAFFGLLSPEFRPEVRPAIQKAVGEGILIKDPVETAREVMEKLRGRADVIILLSDLPIDVNYSLSRDVPGIHFIMGGHEGFVTIQPGQEEKTTILQSSSKGMHIGKLQLTINKPSAPFKDKTRINQVQDQIHNLDNYIATMQKPGQKIQDKERNIKWAKEEKVKYQAELKRISDPTNSNSFQFTLIPLGASLDEDKEIQGWIKEAGIDID